MSLLFNMLPRFVVPFFPRSKCLLISWLQSPSAVILEPKKVKSVTVSIVSPSICHEVMGLNFCEIYHIYFEGLSQWYNSEEFAYKYRNMGLIPGSGRSPGERNSNPFQYSCRGSPMERGAWWPTVHGFTNSQA